MYNSPFLKFSNQRETDIKLAHILVYEVLHNSYHKNHNQPGLELCLADDYCICRALDLGSIQVRLSLNI